MPRSALRASICKVCCGNGTPAENTFRRLVGNPVEPYGGGLAYIAVYRIDGPDRTMPKGSEKGTGDAYQRRHRSSQEGPKHRGVEVAIYRTLFYGDVTVGTGGRMTIPLSMRESCGIRAGDTLTVRVEENPEGIRQLVMWRAKSDLHDT